MLLNPPKTGRELRGWGADIDATHSVGILKHLASWARLQGVPGFWKDWTEDQVRPPTPRAYASSMPRGCERTCCHFLRWYDLSVRAFVVGWGVSEHPNPFRERRRFPWAPGFPGEGPDRKIVVIQ